MSGLRVLLLVTSVLCAQARAAPKVICYVETVYGGISAETLDLGVCTHVIEAFVLPDATGALRAANGLPRRKLVDAAQRRGAQVLVAIGGATVPGATFSAISADPKALSRFANEVSRVVAEGGYDGVDLDWEFPSPAERALQVRLVHAIRTRLDADFSTRRPGRRALVFLGVTPGAHLEGYDFPQLARLTDCFIQFGYDFRNPALGPWSHSAKLWPDGAQQPVEASVRGVASELVGRGVPREKLVIGLPLYSSEGRPWIDVRKAALAAAAPIHPLFLEAEIGHAWITNPAALEAKARRVFAGAEIAGGSAAGIALWQLGHQGPFRELTDAVRRALRHSAPGRAKNPAKSQQAVRP